MARNSPLKMETGCACLATLCLALASCTPTPEREPSPAIGHATFAQRPTTKNGTELPPRYDPSDTVESIASPKGTFRVHFTRSGTHAVNALDSDKNGTPDYVDLVAKTFDEVYALYHDTLTFKVPPSDVIVTDDDGGDGLFDVYLADFGGSSDGAYRLETCGNDGCAGYMVMENDFSGYGYPSLASAVQILTSHEYFHAVQAAYTNRSSTVLSEGSAVWATKRFKPTTRDLEHFAAAYLARPDRSLASDPVGPVQSFAYGSGIFFWFLAQKYGDALMVALWSELATSTASPWTRTLDAVLVRDHTTTFADAFYEFQRWNAATGPRADPSWSYPNGADFLPIKANKVDLPHADDVVRLFSASGRFYRVDPAGAAEIVAAFDGAALEHARILLFAISGNDILGQAQSTDDPTQISASIDSSKATEVLIALVDGRTDGDSQRVALCIGTPEQVAECRGKDTSPDGGPTQTADGGMTDAGTDGPINPQAGDGGGCTVQPDAAAPPVATLLSIVLLLVIRRFRSC